MLALACPTASIGPGGIEIKKIGDRQRLFQRLQSDQVELKWDYTVTGYVYDESFNRTRWN